jgi:hypothetical protein
VPSAGPSARLCCDCGRADPAHVGSGLDLAGAGPGAAAVHVRGRSLCGRPAPRDRHRRPDGDTGARTGKRDRLFRRNGARGWSYRLHPHAGRLLGHARAPRLHDRAARHECGGGRPRRDGRPERRGGATGALRVPRHTVELRSEWVPRPVVVPARGRGRARRAAGDRRAARPCDRARARGRSCGAGGGPSIACAGRGAGATRGQDRFAVRHSRTRGLGWSVGRACRGSDGGGPWARSSWQQIRAAARLTRTRGVRTVARARAGDSSSRVVAAEMAPGAPGRNTSGSGRGRAASCVGLANRRRPTGRERGLERLAIRDSARCDLRVGGARACPVPAATGAAPGYGRRGGEPKAGSYH